MGVGVVTVCVGVLTQPIIGVTTLNNTSNPSTILLKKLSLLNKSELAKEAEHLVENKRNNLKH